MTFEDWLTDPVVIGRHLVNAYFIVMALISLVAILLAVRSRFKWLALYLWAGAGLIGLVWEAVLFATGARDYTFAGSGELLYHALTEGGPGLIITVIFAHWVGIIDASALRDPPVGGTAGGTVDGTEEGVVEGTAEGTTEGTADGTAEGTVEGPVEGGGEG